MSAMRNLCLNRFRHLHPYNDRSFPSISRSAKDSFPDNTQCIRPAVPNGKAYPGAELILTPPATPEPVTIDETMVNQMQSEYKSHFPKANQGTQE